MTEGPRFIGTMEWAERHIRLDGRQFAAKDYPLMKHPARAIDEGAGKVIGLYFPPQVFKTLLVQLRILRTVAVEPVRALFYCKTGEDSLAFSSEKLSPLVDGTPIIQSRFPVQVDYRGGQKLFRFTDAPVSLLSADVRSHRNSRSAQDVYLDEAWQYEKGAMQEIFARTDSYTWRRRRIIATTGSDVDDEVDTLRQTGERWEWHGVCPSCHALTPLEFGGPDDVGGLKWPSDERTREPDGRWRVGPAARETRWVCPLCAKPHEYSTGLLAHLNDERRGAGYVQVNPDGDPKVQFFRASAVAFRDWGELVSEKLKAANARRLGNMELEEEFSRKRAMLPWDPAKLLTASKHVPFGEYNLGDEWEHEGKDPKGQPLRFLTVDVQSGHYWAVIRSWSDKDGHRGESRLLYFGRLVVDGEIEDLRVKYNIHPLGVCLDSAYTPQAVFHLSATRGYLCTNGVKNRDFLHEDNTRRVYSPLRRIDPMLGTELQGRGSSALEFLHSSNGGKHRFTTLRDSKDITGKHYHTVPRDTPDEYLRQAWNETLQRKRNAHGGYDYSWRKLGDNHAFDCEVMQVVLASMYGILSYESLEKEPSKDSVRATE